MVLHRYTFYRGEVRAVGASVRRKDGASFEIGTATYIAKNRYRDEQLKNGNASVDGTTVFIHIDTEDEAFADESRIYVDFIIPIATTDKVIIAVVEINIEE